MIKIDFLHEKNDKERLDLITLRVSGGWCVEYSQTEK